MKRYHHLHPVSRDRSQFARYMQVLACYLNERCAAQSSAIHSPLALNIGWLGMYSWSICLLRSPVLAPWPEAVYSSLAALAATPSTEDSNGEAHAHGMDGCQGLMKAVPSSSKFKINVNVECRVWLPSAAVW